MNDSFFFGLIYNASLLLTLVLVLDFITSKLSGGRICLWKIATGVLLGGIGLAIMHTNWELIPGVIFDTRSVLLGAIGLYFGWIPTLIAVIMTAVFRIYQGGSGVLMGVPVIIEASLIGLIWRAFRSKSLYKLSWFELYIFGLLIHLGMLLCTQLLPEDTRREVLSQIWIPVMAIYPVATVLLGSLLSNRLKRDYSVVELAERESKYKFLFESMTQGVVIQDSAGKIIEANKAAENILGLNIDQLMGKTSFDPRWKMINEDGTNFDPKNTPSNLVLKTGKAVENVIMGIFVVEINKYRWVLASSIPRYKDGEDKPFLTLTTFSDITDRVCGEKRLKESEAKFHSLFESMIEGVALHEIVFNEKGEATNYKLIDVNPSYRVQTGIKGDVKNKLATEVYETETPPYLKEFNEVAVTGKSKVIETYFEPLKRVFKIAIFSLKNNRFATVFEDITEQKKVMKLLMESEEKFSKVFRNSPMIIALSDMKTGKIMEVNAAFEKEFGYKKEDVEGKTSKELSLWNDFVEREDLIINLGKKDSLMDKEYYFRRKNGTTFPALGSISKILVGGSICVLFLGMNIEDRKRAEDKLAQVNMDILMEKRKLEAILRDMGDAVFVTDDKKNIILANRAMVNLFGLTEKEMIGKSVDEALALSYETTGEKPNDLIETVFEKKKQAKPVETLIIKNKNGTAVSVDGIASPIVDENKKLVGTVWVLRDVSKERDLQKMRTDFISLASHQLRTPLTGIKWFVELLDENAPKMPIDKVQEYIRKIGVSNNRMIDLVNDLMTTSRADSGKLEKDTDSYKVRDLLQQAIDEQGRIFLDKNIKIEGLALISEDLVIDADMVQMVQVFGNLMNNAASYSPSGSRIEIGAEPKLSKVQIYIKDHGVGIPLGQQKKYLKNFLGLTIFQRQFPVRDSVFMLQKAWWSHMEERYGLSQKRTLGRPFL